MLYKLIEVIKVLLFSLVEGISEWLPISSSGHLLLLDEFIKLKVSDSFKEVFFIVIQLGAIFAVLITFFKKINPFDIKERKIKKDVILTWKKVIVACIPGAIVALLLDDYIDRYLDNVFTISMMLIIYGIVFILIENFNKSKESKTNDLKELTYKNVLIVGLFQALSIIPGTSRSGATIIGGLLLGINRSVISEFSFFLAIPAMFGLSIIELIDFGFVFTSLEIILLVIGTMLSFLVSFAVIKFLMKYIKNHDFKIFGYYRIIFGLLLLCIYIL